MAKTLNAFLLKSRANLSQMSREYQFQASYLGRSLRYRLGLGEARQDGLNCLGSQGFNFSDFLGGFLSEDLATVCRD